MQSLMKVLVVILSYKAHFKNDMHAPAALQKLQL